MSESCFTKENMDSYLRKLAKKFRKLNGTKMPAEIILVGGASVLLNYGFREKSNDIDAFIRASSVMKDAILAVAEEEGLPRDWINTDFTKTASFSPSIRKYAKYYKTFSNILEIFTVDAEYLVAMKLMAGRLYKNDISDVIGILDEQKRRNQPLTLEQIQTAAKNLYGDYNALPEASRIRIEQALQQDDLQQLYSDSRQGEILNKEVLLDFEESYPNTLTESNLEDILSNIRRKKEAQDSNFRGKLK